MATQPVGPFRLGGYCNGDAVALEAGRLLKAAGHRVELLVLIDVPMVNAFCSCGRRGAWDARTDALLQKKRHYLEALARYFPAPFDIPTVYYSAEHSGKHLKRISASLEIVRLPGDLFSCITTHMDMVAGRNLVGQAYWQTKALRRPSR